MKTIIISYSYTGNNEALAEMVAKELSVKHYKITTSKPMTMVTILLDMMFSRVPRVDPLPAIVKDYDIVLFFGPVWMGQTASPLRAYLNNLKRNSKPYGFISISGGADGGNPKLAQELLKRTGNPPVLLLDQHLSELLPVKSQVTRKETSSYKINEADLMQLTKHTLEAVKGIL
ncbi:hypothetical protein R2R35_00730 [Anaerocolumna sp. AGMB13020]|uniref:flavodoxin family protein n=1 Tax=Anaerocolumna sp. AGMB13020 TaxID=3081750 RepID=UPI0029552674|nr:hypothetical protein [Anaerocolumna sp. AGMB13020]WOO37050.1 hypothetical protein R2R35_00730 [Anaerocolumna sp. AGMB13020]